MQNPNLKAEKIEMVKRIIRRNNYHQYDKSYQQCLDLGLNVNRVALERFSNKLELIDRVLLSKRQDRLQQIDMQRRQDSNQKRVTRPPAAKVTPPKPTVYDKPSASVVTLPVRKPTATEIQPVKAGRNPNFMSVEEIKQRESEITNMLGQLKIREHTLLQELDSLAEALLRKQAKS